MSGKLYFIIKIYYNFMNGCIVLYVLIIYRYLTTNNITYSKQLKVT